MKLVVVSHKVCWEKAGKFQTDGGFPLQMKAISELFDETTLVVPCRKLTNETGLAEIAGKNLKFVPLSEPRGTNWRRKVQFPLWLAGNGWRILREIYRADAVHAPVPGDVGTIGIFGALLLQKPLLVRYCGNWLVQQTRAEKFWRILMEKIGGGKNVMLATGGGDCAPSSKNPAIEWIFSSSLTASEITGNAPRKFPSDGKFKLITACRLEPNKGVETVLESFPKVLEKYPQARLEIVGGGTLLEVLRKQAERAGLRDKVTFYGKVTQQKVCELLREAHVFCYPTNSDGFPKVVLEALAAGLPIITTRVSVLPQLVKAGNGVLLEKATPENLAKAVGEICADSVEYERMSEKSLATAANYSLEKWRETIGEILRRNWRVDSLSGNFPRGAKSAANLEFVK